MVCSMPRVPVSNLKRAFTLAKWGGNSQVTSLLDENECAIFADSIDKFYNFHLEDSTILLEENVEEFDITKKASRSDEGFPQNQWDNDDYDSLYKLLKSPEAFGIRPYTGDGESSTE